MVNALVNAEKHVSNGTQSEVRRLVRTETDSYQVKLTKSVTK